jgi:hypothetical protein
MPTECSVPIQIWRFEAADQLVASNTISEIVGFDGILAMDFSLPIPEDVSVASAVMISTPTGLEIDALIISPNKRLVYLPVVAETVGVYTLAVKATTIDLQDVTRRGDLVIQSETGT